MTDIPTNPTPQTPKEQAKKPFEFDVTACGLGTFLDIANRAIYDQIKAGTLTESGAAVLQKQAIATLWNMGNIAEHLGMERIDYLNDPNNAAATGLMVFGRVMQSMGDMLNDLNVEMKHIAKHRAAPNSPESDTFPFDGF